MTGYNITLDELRDHLNDESVSIGSVLVGARITKGKSIAAVYDDLRIPAATIAEFESNQFGNIENKPYFVGYIRSYAKYLDIDPDALLTVYRERGMLPQSSGAKSKKQSLISKPTRSAVGGLGHSTNRKSNNFDLGLTFSKFAYVVPLLLVLGVVLAGGYGAMRLFAGAQGLDVVPTDAQPVTIDSAGDPIEGSETASVGFEIPEINYEQLYERQALQAPVVEPRVGRIADLTPRNAVGVNSDAEILPTGAETETVTLASAPTQPADPVVSVGPSKPVVELLPLDEAWVSISDQDGTVINEVLLKPGQKLDIPFDGIIPVLRRAGNANLLYVRVNGTVFGPIGVDGETVVNNVALTPQALDTVYDPVGEDVLSPLTEVEAEYLAKLAPTE